MLGAKPDKKASLPSFDEEVRSYIASKIATLEAELLDFEAALKKASGDYDKARIDCAKARGRLSYARMKATEIDNVFATKAGGANRLSGARKSKK